MESGGFSTEFTFGLQEFRLVHYAGDVTYNITGFLDKNNDLLFRDLKEVSSAQVFSCLSYAFVEFRNQRRNWFCWEMSNGS